MKRTRSKSASRTASRSTASRPATSRKRAARAARQPSEPLRLPAALEIHCVRHLAKLAREHLGSDDGVRVDGSAVQSADTAGLQLLVALRRDALANGNSFAWHGTSPTLLEVGAVLGLSASLGFTEAT